MVEGWATDPDSNPMPFQIGHFRDGVLAGIDTYATIGLSKHGLESRVSGRVLFQEILFSVRSEDSSGALPALVHQLGLGLLHKGLATLRGDVIGPMGPVVPGSRLQAFYSAIPIYYDNGFAAVDLESGNRAAIVWMVPIGKAEAAYITEAGWPAFESQLVEQDPDRWI